MLKHQKLFVAMEQRIDSGIPLVDEYNASLESLNCAIASLERLHNGDFTAVQTVQARFAHELSLESVSLEGVQIHINSGQVQAIIDFLRKWIPIIRNKLVELARDFIRWVQTTLNRISERLSSLKDKVGKATQSEFSLDRGPGATRALAYRLLKDGDWVRVFAVSDVGMEMMAGHLKTLNGRSSIGDEVISRAALTVFHRSVSQWVYFDHDTAPSLSYSPTNTQDLLAYVNGLGNFDTGIRNTIVAMSEEARLPPVVILNGSEMKNRMKTLEDGTKRLQDVVQKARGHNDAVARQMDELLKKAQSSNDGAFLMAAKAAVQLTTRADQALTAGLQGRLRLVGAGVEMLERAAA